MLDQYLTPNFYAVVGPLLIAAVLFGRDWFAKNSAKAKEDTLKSSQAALKITLENINLNAEIAARKAEIAAVAAAEAQKIQRDQAGILLAQNLILTQVALDTAETKVQQAATGVKVDGQMTLLHATIAELRSDLAASKLETSTEKDKASTLAVQTSKDTASQEAKVLAAANTSGIEGGGVVPTGQVVVMPEQILPVEEAKSIPLIIAP